MIYRKSIGFLICCLFSIHLMAQRTDQLSEQLFQTPPSSARPWTFWYWMHGAVSKQGITADLEAMRNVGLNGAYLMFIKDTTGAVYKPAASQLSNEWMDLVRFAFIEAKRCGIKLGLHISDGFALAGGPWITPKMSMQQIVWSKTHIKGGKIRNALPLPPHKENHYRDIALYAVRNKFPILSSDSIQPKVTSSHYPDASFLLKGTTETFRADTSAWIQYSFNKPFPARSVHIKPSGNNYQSQRIKILTSDDGISFRELIHTTPPRHGWQDGVANMTYSLPTTSARIFRFEWKREGSEPGSEELDNAKWRAGLKLKGLTLSSEAFIDQFEAKNGAAWRIAFPASGKTEHDRYLSTSDVLEITDHFRNGILDWNAPSGEWTVLRIGHTSTGQTNATGGGARGLECDKFNPIAVQLQLTNWFDSVVNGVGKELTKDVLEVMHVDSWECGSQNWSPVFSSEFKKRRGYAIEPYLPVFAGMPMISPARTEQILRDVRQTIADLINDVFFKTVSDMSKARGLKLSAESVAPTMVSDGMRHYQHADIPMGEFWLNSPTHDKPNDMLDAISGGHIYGKNIIQAESFTQLRMTWKEHPGMLKSIGDRNFTLGINKVVFHIFTHNPWIDRKPGYTLDGIGLYFQRDQTWFRQAKAWTDYIARCQYLLQKGKPVADIAVFTGDELPSRSVLPDRLHSIVPGLIGSNRIRELNARQENSGYPGREIPAGVKSNANMEDPEFWVNPLQGYQYDSFNPDVLQKSKAATGGASVNGKYYPIMLLPGGMKMNPSNQLTKSSLLKLVTLVQEGMYLIADPVYGKGFRWLTAPGTSSLRLGKGKIYFTPWVKTDLAELGITRDVDIHSPDVRPGHLAFTHRVDKDAHVYFLSNQRGIRWQATLSFRVTDMQPELWDPVTGDVQKNIPFETRSGRTFLSIPFAPQGALFIIFRSRQLLTQKVSLPAAQKELKFDLPWTLKFDTAFKGPIAPIKLDSLQYWSTLTDTAARFYSGEAVYANSFTIDTVSGKTWMELESVKDIATIYLNGKKVGIVWTPPYRLDVSQWLKPGRNVVEIAVANTWYNRILLDQSLPLEKRFTFTTSPINVSGSALLPSGLSGKVIMVSE